MIYIGLNFFLFCVLLWFSHYVDVRSSSAKVKQLSVPILILTVSVVMAILCIAFSLYGNNQIAGLCGKLYTFMIGILSVFLASYVCRFPKFAPSKFNNILVIALCIVCFFTSFIKIESLLINPNTGLEAVSEKFLNTNLTWHEAHQILFQAFLPALAVIVSLIKAIFIRLKLTRQQSLFLGAAVIAGWLMIYLFDFIGDNVSPAFDLLVPYVFAFIVYLIFNITGQTLYYEFRYILFRIFSFVINYLLIGVLAGVAFVYIKPQSFSGYAIYACVIAVLLVIRYQLTKFLRKIGRNNSTNYASNFEKDLSTLDYNESSEVLFEAMFKHFKTNVKTSSIHFLIGGTGDEGLVTLFSSSDVKVSIPVNSPIFDVCLNANRTIVFKSQLTSKYFLAGAREELLKLFEEANSEVLILLTEGRHVFSAMLLGKKQLGNEYTEYDYAVFSRYYSYFFVFGYYLKNIANESVVGTVNREIQMSGQIIQSIQENMDFIKNPKVDVGYISVAAHNLGGEYIDFIKLNDTKHIIVLGDLSGKGINASMSSVILKSIVRTFLAETRDFKQLIQKVNRFIRDNLPKGTFFAGAFCLIDFSENTMFYINCGIPALFMYNQSYNNVIEIQGEGRVLGFVKNIEKLVKVKKIKLNPGDILLACTDGLLNAKNIRGEFFGKDRVQYSITENLSFPAEKMSQFLYDQLLDFTSKELEDDVSVLTIKYLSK